MRKSFLKILIQLTVQISQEKKDLFSACFENNERCWKNVLKKGISYKTTGHLMQKKFNQVYQTINFLEVCFLCKISKFKEA